VKDFQEIGQDVQNLADLLREAVPGLVSWGEQVEAAAVQVKQDLDELLRTQK
jgi:hypothetical protein